MSYDWWKAALKSPDKIGLSPDLRISDGNPQPGFYRMKDPDGGDMIPVAYWISKKTGDLVGKRGNEMMKYPVDAWTYCCLYPVTEQDYRAALAGEGWKDTPPARKVEMGDNLPDDPFDALVAELAGEHEIAKELLKAPVKDQDAADKVANFAKRISSLGKKADEMFAVEKRPVLDQAKAVDDKFRDVRELAKSLSTQLKRHIDAFLAEQKKAEQERQRRANEEAEAKRKAAEEAERKAMQEARSVEEAEKLAAKAEAAKAEAEAAEREAKAKAVSAGRTGSKVSMRTFKSAEIVDYDKLVDALKGRDEMKELVQSLANRAAKADHELPGMKIITEERAV